MKQSKQRDLFLTGAAFALFVLVSSHRLTMSALWFDEAIEYWYSKVLTGPLPFSHTANMYERIISTLQPPLYNVLLWLWLRVSDTEWWFRFFGVVAGVVGMAGLHKFVRRYTGKSWLASLTVAGAAFVYRMSFYWQEAAEYCLLLASLLWTVYAYFRLIEEPSRRHIALFIVAAIVPAYSQYGAAFPVVALALTALFCMDTPRRTLELCAGYVAALFVAGLPLYFCFLKKQLPMQRGGSFAGNALSFDGGFLKDTFDSLFKVFRWNLVPDYSGMSTRILLVLTLLLSVAVLIWGRKFARAFVTANVLTWIFYYFAVKAGVYADMSYGGFGNRYNLFFLSVWIPYGIVLLWEGLRILSEEPLLERYGVPTFLLGAAVCFVAASCVISWNTRLSKNWIKDDIREAVYRWYDAGGPDDATLVYYAANGGFAYYVRMTPGYTSDTENRVTYMDWLEGKSAADYHAYFDTLYGPDWPDTLYIVSDHHNADLNVMLDEFRAAGYDVEELYNYDEGARLLRLRVT